MPIGQEPMFHKMADRGRQVGVDMMGEVTRVPNTRLSHILLEWAHEQNPERQHELSGLAFLISMGKPFEPSFHILELWLIKSEQD